MEIDMAIRSICSFFFLFLLVSPNLPAEAREHIVIVGSSTIYPFAQAVTKSFSEKTGQPLPHLKSTGSGGGLQLFCQGIGDEHPDITNASRRIKRSELDLCRTNGVNDIIEIKIGYDGIVFASSTDALPMNLSAKDLYLAIAAQVPATGPGENLIPNPYTNWKEINSTLPDTNIEILGPPPTSGTRDAFSELALEKGCSTFPWIKTIKKRDKQRFRNVCRTIRDDGHFIEAGERDDLIIGNLLQSRLLHGIFGYNFLMQNPDKLQAALINSIVPNMETIASGAYPLSRALYFYVKKKRIVEIPAIADYIESFTDEESWGPDGYLAKMGLIPLDTSERDHYRHSGQNGTVLRFD